MAEVYGEGNGREFKLKIEKAGVEEWLEIQVKWNKGERSSLDGIIVVRELKRRQKKRRKRRECGG